MGNPSYQGNSLEINTTTGARIINNQLKKSLGTG